MASSFPHHLYLPSVSTGFPFAAGWTVSELPTSGPRWVPTLGFGTVGKRSNLMILAHGTEISNSIRILGRFSMKIQYNDETGSSEAIVQNCKEKSQLTYTVQYPALSNDL